MVNRVTVDKVSDLFLPRSKRKPVPGVYFVRLATYGPETRKTLWQYHEAARAKGVMIEGQIKNPVEHQLSYLEEMLGNAFEVNPEFLESVLKKWMPRLNDRNRKQLSSSLSHLFLELKAKGNTDSMLRNVYTKIMVWLYYQFERLIPFLGDEDPPRILYEGNAITKHELMLLRLLSSLGADILLLEPNGDTAYLKQDPASEFSQLLQIEKNPFPSNFTLKQFRKEMTQASILSTQSQVNLKMPSFVRPVVSGQAQQQGTPTVIRSASPGSVPFVQPEKQKQTVNRFVPQAANIVPENYFQAPSITACTNAWMKEADMMQILTPPPKRGDDLRFFYNSFMLLKGCQDKTAYLSQLYRFYQQLRSTNRNIVIVDEGLALPLPEEVQKIKRHNYRSVGELIVDMAGNVPACANVELQKLMQFAFITTMKEAAAKESNLNRLVNSAVYLLCWLRQYQSGLFQGYKGKEIACFILMGGCQTQHDALFMLMLSKLPVDVLVLAPDLSQECTLSSPSLLELSGSESLPVNKFPREASSLQMRTVASFAEQELEHELFNSESGLFRNRQFAKAETITLQTTYEEIFINWDQDLKYRSNFSANAGIVNMPVIYAKVCGVEKRNEALFWQKVKALSSLQNVFFIKNTPYIENGTLNPFQSLAVKSIHNGKLDSKTLKENRQFPFALLREELQEHILEKIQLMLDKRMIKGTFVNGTEYTVLATILNLQKELLRLLQSFDFTKKNPKIVSVSTSDRTVSLEDTILFTFLNMVGFDIVMFVPTGYQTVERYLTDHYPIEHQIGDYLYDLQVPDFNALPPPKSRSFLDVILKRGQ